MRCWEQLEISGLTHLTLRECIEWQRHSPGQPNGIRNWFFLTISKWFLVQNQLPQAVCWSKMVEEKRLRIGEKRLYRILQVFFMSASLFGMCSASIRNGQLQVVSVTRSKIVLTLYCVCLSVAFIGNLTQSGDSSDFIFCLGYMFQSFSAYISLYMLYFRLETLQSILKILSEVFAQLEPRYTKCQLQIAFYVFAGLIIPVFIRSLEILNTYWFKVKVTNFYLLMKISGVIFRKIPLAYNVAFFCCLCVCIQDAIVNLNAELSIGFQTESKFAELVLCHDQLYEVVELINNLFGLQLLVILVGSNAFLHNDILFYYKIIFNHIYGIQGNESDFDVFFFSWILFDTSRIMFFFWSACSLVHEVKWLKCMAHNLITCYTYRVKKLKAFLLN